MKKVNSLIGRWEGELAGRWYMDGMVYRHGGATGGFVLCGIRVRKVKTDFSGLFFKALFIYKIWPFPLENR